MRRAISYWLLCLLLTAQPVFAQSAENAQPLAPGKAAGTHDAQMTSDTAIFLGALALVLIGGIYLSSGSYKPPSQPGVSAAPATTP